jgi:DNA-binding NtrC family response regulator
MDDWMIGPSDAMQRVRERVQEASRSDAPVLLVGEGGTGRSIAARLIHATGPRCANRFVEVSLDAIPPILIREELLFGSSDPQTGTLRRVGRFVEADRGTLFLDGITALSMTLQRLLVDTMKAGAVPAFLDRPPMPAFVRVIASSSAELTPLVSEGVFRADLAERLCAHVIRIPPLRERKEDIPFLARYFARRFAEQFGRDVPELSEDLLRVMARSEWPGNVNMLAHYIERLCAMTPSGPLRPEPPPLA